MDGKRGNGGEGDFLDELDKTVQPDEGGDWDELLTEANERLAEQEGDDPNAELGDEMTPEPGTAFKGRWRSSEGKMQTKGRGVVDVYLVWDTDDQPGFLYQHSRLVQEVEAEQPESGDWVLILRGATQQYEKDGEERQIYPYVLRKRACSNPLPSGGSPDIPF